jgi:hypothetical protein
MLWMSTARTTQQAVHAQPSSNCLLPPSRLARRHSTPPLPPLTRRDAPAAATSRLASDANSATFARGERTAQRSNDTEALQADPGRDAGQYTAGAAAISPGTALTAAAGNSSAVALGVNGGPCAAARRDARC